MKLVSTDRKLKDDASELIVKFESEAQGGVKLIKSFILKRGEYAISVKHEISNTAQPQ
jgi:YidC/Oxa1 family membrane protein insertase